MSRKEHGLRLTVEELLQEMDRAMSDNEKAAQGLEEPTLGRGYHFGFVSATAIWASYVSKLKAHTEPDSAASPERAT